MSDEGCLVGPCIEDSVAKYLSGGPFSLQLLGHSPPVVEAVRSMRLSLDLPFQALE